MTALLRPAGVVLLVAAALSHASMAIGQVGPGVARQLAPLPLPGRESQEAVWASASKSAEALARAHAAYAAFDQASASLRNATDDESRLMNATRRSIAWSAFVDAIFTIGRYLREEDADVAATVGGILVLARQMEQEPRVWLYQQLLGCGKPGLDALRAEMLLLIAYEHREFGTLIDDELRRRMYGLMDREASQASGRTQSRLWYDFDFEAAATAWLRSDEVGPHDDPDPAERAYSRISDFVVLARAASSYGSIADAIFRAAENAADDLLPAGRRTRIRREIEFVRENREQGDRIFSLERRLAEFEKEVRQQFGEIHEVLEEHARRLHAHDDAIRQLQEEVHEHRRRLEALENWAANIPLDDAEKSELLRRLAPILIPDQATDVSGPFMRPSEFAEGCSIGYPNLSDEGRDVWTATQLRDWLTDERNAKASTSLEMVPNSLRAWHGLDHEDEETRQRNAGARANGYGIFGHVDTNDNAEHVASDDTEISYPEHTHSVKYFAFLGYNDAHFPGKEGDHEGDWLCIDLQVRCQFVPGGGIVDSPVVLYAIIHNHGMQHAVPRERLTFLEVDGEPRLHIYLEQESNEPHPRKGDDDFFAAVRPHNGYGLPYDLRRAFDSEGPVHNLDSDTCLDAELVRLWRGQWGEFDGDVHKSMPWGKDVTNPHGPSFQDKMWRRSFSKYPSDPIGR